LVTASKRRQKLGNPDEDAGVRGHASETRAAGLVTLDAEDPRKNQARRTAIGEAMRMNRVPDGDVAVEIATRPMETNHDENAAMFRRGLKRWNYLWTRILRITRTPRMVEGVAVVVDDGDNHLVLSAGWFSTALP